MDKIKLLKELIEKQRHHSMTPEERQAQMESFVVGNSFDVFSTPNVINHGNVKELLNVHKIHATK